MPESRWTVRECGVTDCRSSASLTCVHRRLAIDYGAATVRAVLVSPGGATVLPLDGAGEMSTAVHVSGAGVVVGAAAWRQAGTDPDGFVLSPLRAGTGHVVAGGVEVEVVDLVAATLRQVLAAAQAAAGEPIEDVRLVIPAGWGPRRRTWLRHAARGAGLTVSRLVEAPIAATRMHREAAAGQAVAAGPLLVVDVGAGCEVTVVRHGPAGGEVLSTLADAEAGGDRLDAAALQSLTRAGLPDLPADARWPMLANLRTARHALSEQVAVTMALPDGRPPMVINTAQVTETARPVFERAGELAAQALDNADLTVEQTSAVCLIGAAALTPGAAQMIAAKLGVTAQLVDRPHLAAVLGAADADTLGPADDDGERLRLPPLRRLVTLALPGAASLALYAHFVLAADFNNGTPARPGVGYYVLASWGELAVAALLAMICCLQAASLFAVLLDRHRVLTPAPPAPSRVTAGVGLAVAAGLATAGLYAVTAAVFFNQPISFLARWALLPILPTAGLRGEF